MIRTSSHSLKWSSKIKESNIDSLFEEYQRVVQFYIDKLWSYEFVSGSFVDKTILNGVETWLSARLKQCAGKQAIQIVKSTQKKNRDLIFKQYKRIFAKAKARNKNWEILKSRYSTWIKGRIYKKVNKPIFSGDSIELDQRFISIEDGNNSFDLWIKLSSIGNKLVFYIPTRKHKHFNELQSKNYHLKKSCRLRRYKKVYFIDLFHEKEAEEIKVDGKEIGIDIGINKLIATSDNQILGSDLKPIINKLNTRKRGSRNYEQTCREIRNYINKEINKIEWNNYNLCVTEDVTNIVENTIKNKNKETKNLLSHWNQRFLLDRIKLRCEDNRVLFASVNPAYTSQTCSVCNHIDANSRKGEIFKCTKCNSVLDADYNASINILNRYLDEVSIVPRETKTNFHVNSC